MKALPFNDDELALETGDLLNDLTKVNSAGFLTINSQPPVNAAPSTSEKYGWGGPGGYIYQKAYLEFFMHKDYVPYLLDTLKEYPRVNYHIIDSEVSPFCVSLDLFNLPGFIIDLESLNSFKIYINENCEEEQIYFPLLN